MRRIISFATTLFFLSAATSTQAQLLSGDAADSTLPKPEFGIKAGANMQNISGATWENSYHTGFSGGFWARLHKNRIGVRAEILVSMFSINSASIDSAGFRHYIITDSVGTQGKFRATYLDVPVLLEITVAPKVLVLAGVQYSNLLSLSNVTSIIGTYKTLFRQSEFAAVIGAEVNLPKNFSIGARYKYGLSDLNNKDVSLTSESWKTTAIQLYLSYKIK